VNAGWWILPFAVLGTVVWFVGLFLLIRLLIQL